jgi:hypothetical protein
MTCQTCNLTIAADATWSQSMWLIDGNQPVNLTGKIVELRVLPAFNYAPPIRVLTSYGAGEITIDNAATGAISVLVTQANVAASLPPGVWNYFLRVLNGPSDTTEYLRGNLTVLAGRTS